MAKLAYDYAGTVTLVTGGASGIGRAISGAFAAAGSTVAIADINLEAAEIAVKEIEANGGSARAFHVDVGDETSVSALIEAIWSQLGRLDQAINNAGIEANTVPLADLDSANWRRVTDVNLSAIFYCMKAQLRSFLDKGVKGVIVNTASVSGLMGGYNLSAYTATKHGVVGLTKAASMDYAAKGIRINALCPGLVDTPFISALPQPVIDRLVFAIPMGRPGKAEEMAKAVLWLCSEDASYVTGHAMVVDGGTSLGGTGTRMDDLLEAGGQH